ncbi:TraB/GumN family protein [Ideonella sp.]|uniref:TraB/GumN family protein n=1 Tax=Ideonella sp. TaxID=1929293 RepID=UPI003BB4F75A
MSYFEHFEWTRPAHRWLPRMAALALCLAAVLLGRAGAAEPVCPPPPAELDAETVQKGQREARDHGLLWRATRGGRTIWLYGTMHAAKLEWMYTGPTVLAALLAADTVAFELNLLDPAIGQRVGQAMQQPAGATPLPAGLAARLQQQEAAVCVDAALAARLRPEVRLAMLSLLSLRGDGLEAAYGVDSYLMGLAQGLRKKVVGLETPEEQFAALLEPDPVALTQLVEESLADLESGRAHRGVLRLVQAWAGSRFDELNRYTEWCECADTPAQRAVLKRMLDDRNRVQVERIIQAQQQSPALFVAVGALHMVGPQGLPALLAARGYQVDLVALPAQAPTSGAGERRINPVQAQ